MFEDGARMTVGTIEIAGEEMGVDGSAKCARLVGTLLAATGSDAIGDYEPTKAVAVFRRAGGSWVTASVRGIQLLIRFDGREHILDKTYAGAKYPTELYRGTLLGAIAYANML